MNPPSRFLRRWRCQWTALLVVCCGVLPGLVTPVLAGADYYLKISDVPGEIAVGGFSGWTRLTGISAEVKRVLPPLPATEPITRIEVRLTKAPGPVSSPLLLRCASGVVTPKIILVCVEDTQPVLRITLSDVMISSFQSSSAGGPPQDDFGCTFRSIEWSHSEHDGASGGNSATFNLAAQLGSIKPRLPFRAVLEGAPREPGSMRLTCPVEAGHRYRVSGNLKLNGPWNTLQEFTAEIDGVMDVTIPRTGPVLFVRVEEVE